MRKRFSAVLFFISSISVFSQDYKPLLDNLNEWQLTSCNFGCLTDVYYTDGDTVVDGKNYKILDGFHYISRTFLLREEINNKKVFLNKVSPGQNEEFLLYDFSLNEGDSFQMANPYSPFPQDGGFFVVDSIVERILEDGNEYKHFYFSPAPGNTTSFNNSVWIEGVGSLSLINAPGGNPDINGAGHLSCFFKNAEIFYSNLDSIESCVPVHLGIEKYNLSGVTISKIINETQCVLNNAKEIKTVIVYDFTGKKLQEIETKGEDAVKIDLSSYKNGLYIILAKGYNNKTKSFKVIK